MKRKARPDIRALTRLVPSGGNLVQGQSELAINPALAEAASRVIAASQNHYGPAEGLIELRRAVAEKINTFNGVLIDPEGDPLQLLITPGATGALIAIAQTYLTSASALVFEPYYPYHRHILTELGGTTEVLLLHGERLELDVDELRARCRELKNRKTFPLRAIILCTPVNPSGKVFSKNELEAIAAVCESSFNSPQKMSFVGPATS
ncbi:MAG TPA: aminotransferase class I/II-fold pyridoxal phosphate-dependent enzyme [Pyrinomonadaceae bacterium]